MSTDDKPKPTVSFNVATGRHSIDLKGLPPGEYDARMTVVNTPEQRSFNSHEDFMDYAERRRDRVRMMAGIHRTPQTLLGTGVIAVRLVGLQNHAFVTNETTSEGWLMTSVGSIARPRWHAEADARLGGVEGTPGLGKWEGTIVRPVPHMGGFWGWQSPHGLQIPRGCSGLWQLSIHTPGRQRRLGLAPEDVMGRPTGVETGDASQRDFMLDSDGRGPSRSEFQDEWWHMVGVTGHLSLLMTTDMISKLMGDQGFPLNDGGLRLFMQSARARAEHELFFLDAGDLVGQVMVWDEGGDDKVGEFGDELGDEVSAEEEHATDMMIYHSQEGI